MEVNCSKFVGRSFLKRVLTFSPPLNRFQTFIQEVELYYRVLLSSERTVFFSRRTSDLLFFYLSVLADWKLLTFHKKCLADFTLWWREGNEKTLKVIRLLRGRPRKHPAVSFTAPAAALAAVTADSTLRISENPQSVI